MTTRLPPASLDPTDHDTVLDEMIERGIVLDHGETFAEAPGALAAYCAAHPREDAAGLRLFVAGVVAHDGRDPPGQAIAA